MYRYCSATNDAHLTGSSGFLKNGASLDRALFGPSHASFGACQRELMHAVLLRRVLAYKCVKGRPKKGV
jgi:hypothetical protein